MNSNGNSIFSHMKNIKKTGKKREESDRRHNKKIQKWQYSSISDFCENNRKNTT